MNVKRAALSGLSSTKPNAPAPDEEAVINRPKPKKLKVPGSDGRRGYTLRIDPVALKQLGQIALEEDKPVRELFIEAINALFRDRKVPPIAE